MSLVVIRGLLWSLLVLALVGAGRAARADDIPEPIDIPPSVEDYRIAYDAAFGTWEGGEQYTMHHRLRLQIPLWRTAIGAVLPFANAFGEVNGSAVGNLQLYVQWFYRWRFGSRTGLYLGGGVDLYAPTATPHGEQVDVLAVPVAGDSGLHAPDTDVTVRPRLHIGAQAWIFSFQLVAGPSVHFEGSYASIALDWGLSAAATPLRWLAIFVEAVGVSWFDEPPAWSPQHVTSIGGGLRFPLPYGISPALWVRVPVTGAGPDTDHGRGVFVGAQLMWEHSRVSMVF